MSRNGENGKERRARRRPRRWLRGSLLAVAAVLGVLGAGVAGVLAVADGWFPGPRRALVELGLSLALGGEVRLEAVEGSLLDSFTLRGLRVRKLGSTGTLRVANAEVRAEPLDWRPGRILEIQSLGLEGLEATAELRPDGSWEVSGLGALAAADTKPGDPGSGLPIALQHGVLRDAQLRITWPGDRGSQHLGGRLDLEARDLHWPSDAAHPWPSRAALRLRVESSRVGGCEIAAADLSLRSDGPGLALDELALDSDCGRGTGRGSAQLAGRLDAPSLELFEIASALEQVDVGRLLRRPELESTLAGDVELVLQEASAAKPPTQRIALRVELAASRFADEPIDSGALTGSLELASPSEARWALPLAVLQGPTGRIEARGEGVGERIDELLVKLSDLDLAALPEPWRARAGLADLSGRLDAEARVAGAWRDPSGEASLRVESLSGRGQGPVDLALRVRAQGGLRFELDELTVETLAEPRLRVRARPGARIAIAPAFDGLRFEALDLGWNGPGRLRAHGAIEQGDASPLAFALEGLDVAAVAARLSSQLDLPSQLDLGGTLDGELELRGPLDAPSPVGRATWRDPRLGSARAETLRIDATSAAGRLELDGVLQGEGRNALRIRGGADLQSALRAPRELLARDDSKLSIAAEGLDLAWVARLSEDLLRIGGISGTLDGRLDLQGARDGPQLRGELRVVDAAITPPDSATAIGPLNGDIRLLGSRAEIPSLRIGSGDRVATLRGTASWGRAGLEGVDLAVGFDRYPLSELPLLVGRLEGELTLRGEAAALEARGALTLHEARLTLRDSLDPLFKEIRIRGLPDAAAPSRVRERRRETPDLLEASSADISLAVAPGSWVRGQDLDAEIEGRLRLRKRPGGAPQLLGSLKVVKGSYRFRGRRLDLERGVLLFAGETPPDPQLDLLAVRSFPDVTVRVRVGGSVSEPKLELSSDPPIGSNDILAYLIFGRPASQLGRAEGEGLESAAATLVGQALLGEYGTEIAQTLGVDAIGIEVAGEGTGPTLELEKQVGEDIWVRYGHTFRTGETGGGERVEVEWRFWKSFGLRSDVTSAGTSGADLTWRHDY